LRKALADDDHVDAGFAQLLEQIVGYGTALEEARNQVRSGVGSVVVA
jgi:hypothetical protein